MNSHIDKQDFSTCRYTHTYRAVCLAQFNFAQQFIFGASAFECTYIHLSHLLLWCVFYSLFCFCVEFLHRFEYYFHPRFVSCRLCYFLYYSCSVLDTEFSLPRYVRYILFLSFIELDFFFGRFQWLCGLRNKSSVAPLQEFCFRFCTFISHYTQAYIFSISKNRSSYFSLWTFT